MAENWLGEFLTQFDSKSIEFTNEKVVESICQFLNAEIGDWMFENGGRVQPFLEWLLNVYSKCPLAKYYALKAITKVIKCIPSSRMFILIELFSTQNLVYSCLGADGVFVKSELYLQAVLDCIAAIFDDFNTSTLSNKQMMSCKAVFVFLCRMNYTKNFDTLQFPGIILHSLILLKKFVLICEDDVPIHMEELLGTCLAYMFFGNPIKKKYLRPQRVTPFSKILENSSDDVDSHNANSNFENNGKFMKQKKLRLLKSRGVPFQALEICQKNDKVERSVNIENNNQQNKNEICEDIRMASLYLLGDIVRKAQQHVLSSYWQALFLSDLDGKSDIFLVSETDESSKCRCVALKLCVDLFLSTKSLFRKAEYRKRTAAFVPLSQKLGLTILLSYKSITGTIQREDSVSVLLQALKCAAALVQVTPFDRFEGEFIYYFVSSIKRLVVHNDYTIQVCSLTVLEFLLLNPKLPIDAAHALGLHKKSLSSIYSEVDLKLNFSNNLEKSTKEEINFEPYWFIFNIFHNLDHLSEVAKGKKTQIATPLRVKSFQLLSAMANHFELFLIDHLDGLASVLEKALIDNNFEIRLCSSKCVDVVLYQMSAILGRTILSIDKFIAFCVRIIPAIMNVIQIETELNAIKIVLVDAISNIGLLVFENLPERIRMCLLGFLTGLCSERSADGLLRATVVRALSIFVKFSSMRTNLVFIENTAHMLLKLTNDRNTNVRIKIAWSMGNISDVLVENNMEVCSERISTALILSLLGKASEACSDTDKVRCNAVRSIGNLMRLLSEQHFAKESNRTQIKLAFNNLIDGIRSARTAKVRWNSCYAVGNLLQNESLFSNMNMLKDTICQSSLYSALCHAIYNCSNYKVKINAAMAMLHIRQRSHIGEHLGIIWKTIIQVLEQTHYLQNFNEYNYRDLLQEKLCLLLGHILNLALVDDYFLLSRILLERIEVVRNTWIRVTRRMIPEKVAALLSCSSYLFELLPSNSLNTEQKKSLNIILKAIPLDIN